MAEEPSTAQERTESPTVRRREQAHEEGRIARSQELSTAVVILAGTIALGTAGGRSLGGFAIRVLQEGARTLSAGPMGPGATIGTLQMLVIGLVVALLPFAAAVVALTLFVNLAQARGVLSWKPVQPRWSNLNPLTGIKRLFNAEAAFALFKTVAKLVALALVTWVLLSKSWPELTSLAGAGPAEITSVLRTLVVRLAIVTGLAFLVIALVDYGFQYFRLEKSLRMSRQEVVREYRETEGDPLVKGRILSIARARARRRMLQQVPKADVVVTNPTHVAVALKYDTDVAMAPVVVAMGERKLAERIKALALKSGVPVLENRPVARALLATAKVGRPIPPALYAAIAEILAYVYRRRAGLPAALPGSGRTA